MTEGVYMVPGENELPPPGVAAKDQCEVCGFERASHGHGDDHPFLLSPKEALGAQQALHAAIVAYYARVQPEAFVTGWVLSAAKETIALSQQNSSMVGTVIPFGQSFVLSRGLIEITLDAMRAGGGPT